MNIAIMKFKSSAILTVAAVVSLVGSAAVASTYSAAVLSLSPVGYWQLNGNTDDSTANVQNGTWENGSATYVSGPRPSDGFAGMAPLNQSGDFDNARFVEISDNAAYQFDSGDAFSMVSWIKAPSSQSGVYTMIFAKQLNDTPFAGYYMALASGKLEAVRQAGLENDFDVLTADEPAPLTDESWHMLVSTTTGGFGSSTMQLYINGVLATTTTATDTLSGSMLNAAPLTIGARDTAGGVPFLGQIDEAALFNYALTDQQVATLWNAAVVPEPSTLALVGVGAIGVATYVRRRSRRECPR